MIWLVQKSFILVINVVLLVLAWHYRHEIAHAVRDLVHFIKELS